MGNMAGRSGSKESLGQKNQGVQTVCSLEDFSLHKRVKPVRVGEKNGVNRSAACLKAVEKKKERKEKKRATQYTFGVGKED